MPLSAPATQKQIEALLEFMSNNEELARGLLRGADGRIRARRLWENLSNSLNSMGGCTKSVEQWQRVWADRKHQAKKAAAGARRSACKTSGGPAVALTLSDIELRILSIMGESFGEPQTQARVPAFSTGPPVKQEPAATSPAPVPTRLSQGQSSTSSEALDLELGTQTQQSSSTRRNRRAHTRVRRHLADPRTRIVELEEQRLQVEIKRNEMLGEIKVAIVDLCNLVMEHLSRNR